jgi:hypothetical protein
LGGDEDGDETVIGGTEEVSEVRGADCFFLWILLVLFENG